MINKMYKKFITKKIMNRIIFNNKKLIFQKVNQNKNKKQMKMTYKMRILKQILKMLKRKIFYLLQECLKDLKF